MTEHERQAKIEQARARARARAEQCAESFVRRGSYCAGCPLSMICPIERLWRAKYGPSIIDTLLADPVIRQNVAVINLNREWR